MKKVFLHIQITKELKEDLKKLAFSKGLNLSGLVKLILTEEAKKNKS